MISDGYLVGDGSWDLTIYVTDLKVERKVRVKGDLHIGGVMLKLVEDLDVAIDWSDHALWWPQKNSDKSGMWLSRTRTTLDQYGVQADALLHFTPMHKTLRVQLPDLRFMDARVDFSVKTFTAVVQLCKDLGIRYPEELSFSRPLIPEHLKRNFRGMGVSPRQRARDSMGPIVQTSPPGNIISTPDGKSSPNLSMDDKTPTNTWNGSGKSHSMLNGNSKKPHSNYSSPNNSLLYGADIATPSLAVSPASPSLEARTALLRPRSLVERARLNSGWLDSSLSLFEQDVREFDLLLLRFKFYSYYDLNPKLDSVRINQIYEQARWSILTEEIDCTEDEMMMFSALQMQISLQANNPFPEKTSSLNEDDIDSALNDLQLQLEGAPILSNNIHNTDIIHVPELADYLRFMKPKKFTLKTFKRYYFVFRDTRLSVFKSREDRSSNETAFVINLRGCETTPDVNLSQRKYGIRLEVPSQEGMVEYLIRCDSEQQYANWMAAFKLASKGRTMADSSYDNEVRSILDFLSMQHPAPSPAINSHNYDLNPEEYCAPKFIKKKGSRQIAQRMLEAHTNVKDLTTLEAKLHFIKAWQALPDYGISLFVVKFANSKKEELLGVAQNRLMRMDINTGDHIKTWRFNRMKAWNVNWEVRQMMVQFDDGEDVVFACLSADCKVCHEFIGGYIFLSMRSKDQNQTLNEELFHKLTGGWI